MTLLGQRLGGERSDDIGRHRPDPWLKVLIAAIAAVVLAIVGLMLFPLAQTSAPPQTQPPVTAPQETDPSTEALNGAAAAYQKYNDAYWSYNSDGRRANFPENVRQLTTGKAWEYAKEDARASRKRRYVYDGGGAVVTILKSDVSNASLVSLTVCLDMRRVSAKDAAGNVIDFPDWGSSTATMKLTEGSWRLADRTDRVERSPCNG